MSVARRYLNSVLAVDSELADQAVPRFIAAIVRGCSIPLALELLGHSASCAYHQ
jgi:hypothetical protein